MNESELRRKNQLEILHSTTEIEVGNKSDLPLALEQIVAIDSNSKYVEQVFNGGLTAVVYKLNIDGTTYNLKKKRENILVQNIDGQTSFLNEVQRRKDYETIRKNNKVIDQGIVKTIYASLQHGFILSEWIDGEHIKDFNHDVFEQLYNILFNNEINGIFEWDLCSGNLLVDSFGNVKLFDFGYCYLFDPLQHFNSDGLQNPMFHFIERLESRTYMQYLLELEEKTNLDEVLNHYKDSLVVGLKYYRLKLNWLREHHADQVIIQFYEQLISEMNLATQQKDELTRYYAKNSFRSYIIEIHDDLSGKTCTKYTIKKVDKILELLKNKYEFLVEQQALIWGDERLSQQQLLDKYLVNKKLILEYQV